MAPPVRRFRSDSVSETSLHLAFRDVESHACGLVERVVGASRSRETAIVRRSTTRSSSVVTVRRQQRWSRGLDTRGPGHSRCTLGGRVVAAHAAIPCGAGERLDRRFQLPTRCPRPHERRACAIEPARAATRRSGVAPCATCRRKRRRDVVARRSLAVVGGLGCSRRQRTLVVWALFLRSPRRGRVRSASTVGREPRSLQADRRAKVRSMQRRHGALRLPRCGGRPRSCRGSQRVVVALAAWTAARRSQHSAIAARAAFEEKHRAREITITASRQAIQACAASIRSTHRGEYDAAESARARSA